MFTLGNYDSANDQSGVISIGDNEDLVGFYGVQGSTAIRTLGFLFMDRTCVEDKLGADALKGIVPSDEEDSDTVLIVVLVIAGVFVIGGAVVIGICCCQKRSKSSRIQTTPIVVTTVGG